jgi:transcriptional regulator with XRE-family HTH domain
MASRTPPTVRMRRLASELRRLRGAAGMSREDVAERTDINVATLYRLETAKGRPQRRTLTSLLELYQVAPEERDALFALLKAAGEKGWVQPFAGAIPEESEAASVRNYESLLIPGLLQTAGYIAASSAGQSPLMPGDQIDLQAKIRVGRQDLLTRSNPLALWAIVDEAVLRREVGGAEVMRDQFEHLLSMMELPNVTFQIVPFSAGSHAGMLGSFSVLDFPDPDPTVACVETMAGSMFQETEDEVRACTVAFDHLRATAASPAESARMVMDRLR